MYLTSQSYFLKHSDLLECDFLYDHIAEADMSSQCKEKSTSDRLQKTQLYSMYYISLISIMLIRPVPLHDIK